jgi:hypothetical protein
MRRADPRKPHRLARRAAGKVASPFSKDVPFRSELRDHMSNRIGIVTGGEDCPGLNAVIRAVSKAVAKRDSVKLSIYWLVSSIPIPVNTRVRRKSYSTSRGFLLRLQFTFLSSS